MVTPINKVHEQNQSSGRQATTQPARQIQTNSRQQFHHHRSLVLNARSKKIHQENQNRFNFYRQERIEPLIN